MKYSELSNREQDHRHGGEPNLDFKRLGLSPPPDVIDFSVNISPFGPPESIMAAWNTLAPEAGKYPSIDGEGLARFYQEKFGLEKQCIIPGNGSTELVYLVPRVLGLKKTAVLSPSFHDYTRSMQLAGGAVYGLNLSPHNDFAAPSLEDLMDLLKNVDAIFIGNPNNPTGTLFPKADLLALARDFPDKWILVDEAFIQFVENFREVTLIMETSLPPNILIFHSLTKFYALPGLRLGCVIGHRDIINRLRFYKEPWTVNRIAEKTALCLIGCEKYEEKVRDLIVKERDRISQKIKKIEGIRVIPGYANFFLAKWKVTNKLDDLLKRLYTEGLYVRDCRNFPTLEDNFFRFAIRRPEGNDRLLRALKQCAEEFYV